MKFFVALVTLFTLQLAFGQDGSTTLLADDLSLSAAHSQIISIEPSEDKSESIVTVRVTLSGCMDRLGGHFSTFNVVDGNGILSFGAINIFNKASMSVRCYRAPTKEIAISVPFTGQIALQPMEYAEAK